MMKTTTIIALLAVATCMPAHADAGDPTPEAFLQAFPLSFLTNELGVTIESEIDTTSTHDSAPTGTVNIYVIRINKDIEWSRIPYLTIKMGPADSIYRLPPKKYLFDFQTDKVGSRSYGRDIRSKGDTIVGSRIVYTSSNKKWDVSVYSDLNERKLKEITALAIKIDKWVTKISEQPAGAVTQESAQSAAP